MISRLLSWFKRPPSVFNILIDKDAIVRSGDALVLSFKNHLKDEDIAALEEKIKSALPDNCRIFFIDNRELLWKNFARNNSNKIKIIS